MNSHDLQILLQKLYDRETSPELALESLKYLPFENIGFAKVDSHRYLRKGFPEVIYGQGKTVEQVLEITKSLASKFPNILITRGQLEMYTAIKPLYPETRFYPSSRVITIHREKHDQGMGKILVISAGTSDIPVAEEASVTAEIMGNRVSNIYDVGVAGIHRLVSLKDELAETRVLIVVAGMEGALPSVIGGIVDKPIIAVPTSVGYGASFGGLSALLGMLNSCASGVVVVNIDNGFGAGYTASLINKKWD